MMKLYDRDYTELRGDEKAKWASLRQEEVNKLGTLEVRQNRFRDYPKAVRHFMHLFPNNYLDTVELQDENRLKSQLDQFRQLIDSDNVTERAITKFIKQNRAYFIVASILKRYFSFGHHGAYLFPEFQLGNSYQADNLLVGKSSDGWHFVFVELEAPVGNITLRNGNLGSAFRDGLDQVADWDTWLQAHYDSLMETFDKYRRTDECLPDDFFKFDKSRFHYVVVAGRRTDFKQKTYRIRRNKGKDNSELILHYDNLVDAAENIIGKDTY
ncbi:MAG: DUF4263 domain-containing protein [Phycisphaerae bacterium]|nr:DUF4263 domain-containing protein [Phycisphaerae bacterium]